MPPSLVLTSRVSVWGASSVAGLSGAWGEAVTSSLAFVRATAGYGPGSGRGPGDRDVRHRVMVGSRSWISVPATTPGERVGQRIVDRKSTRLNSSHVKISYAVFCL